MFLILFRTIQWWTTDPILFQQVDIIFPWVCTPEAILCHPHIPLAMSLHSGKCHYDSLINCFCVTDPSKYAGLNYEPSDVDFLNEVAAEIPTLWREVGMELGLKPHQLDCIEIEQNRNQVRCFGAAFRKWMEQQTSPCTWATIIQALQTKAVSQHKLAQELKRKFATP